MPRLQGRDSADAILLPPWTCPDTAKAPSAEISRRDPVQLQSVYARLLAGCAVWARRAGMNVRLFTRKIRRLPFVVRRIEKV
jgi:hypothetical protein